MVFSFRGAAVAAVAAATVVWGGAVGWGASASFTWLNGSKTKGEPGIYGTRGVTSPENTPGARYGHIRWKDAAGNLWMFGGSGHDVADVKGAMNDLWKLDAATGYWTWIAGPNTSKQMGTYGTKGVAADANIPGGRGGCATWLDTAGKLWLFGGLGNGKAAFGALNDVWCFDPETGLWTWIAGSDEPELPPAGIGEPPAAENTPGGVSGVCCWKDSQGLVWIFGGIKGSSVNNRMWRFDPAAGVWQHIAGNEEDTEPVYGTLGVPSAQANPGARIYACYWIDDEGNFRLFGGRTQAGSRNDMWRYSPATGLWTWLGGSQEVNDNGTYGSLGAIGDSWPAARVYAGHDQDSRGNLLLFGGSNRSDLWMYNVAHEAWIWLHGTNAYQTPVYGTIGVAAPANTPGGQETPSLWLANTGNAYVFGGARFAIGSWNHTFRANISFSTDLAISTTASTDSLLLGQSVACSTVVTNNGDDPAADVKITLTLPSEAIDVAAVSDHGTVTITQAGVDVSIPSLAPGTSVHVVVTFTPTIPQSSTCAAVVTSTTPDPNQQNNSASANVAVVQGDGPDLVITDAPLVQVCKTKTSGTTCQIKGQVALMNAGNQPAPKSAARIFLSDDNRLDPTDLVLKPLKVKKLKPGKSTGKKVAATLASGVTATGKFLICIADPDRVMTEGNEFNNMKIVGPLQ